MQPVAEVDVFAAPPVETLVKRADRPQSIGAHRHIRRPEHRPWRGQSGEIVAVLLVELLPDVQVHALGVHPRDARIRIIYVDRGDDLLGIFVAAVHPVHVPDDG